MRIIDCLLDDVDNISDKCKKARRKMNFEIKKQKKIIVCLTGMPGAGKSTIAFSLKEKGFPVITMGDAGPEEA